MGNTSFKMGSTFKEGANYFLYKLVPHLKREAKLKLAKLLHLKVYHSFEEQPFMREVHGSKFAVENVVCHLKTQFATY